MKTCHIMGASPCQPVPFSPEAGDLVIASDGGYTHLERIGVTPDIVLGDFDSLRSPPSDIEVRTYPKEKDDTDMMLAVKYGLEKGFRQFHLYGGLGAQLDHTLANLQAVVFLARNGARGTLFDETTCVTAICSDTLRFDASMRGTISVFAHDERVEGVTLHGLQYPLRDATLTNGFPLGVSNAFTGVESSITVRKGTLLVIWHQKI